MSKDRKKDNRGKYPALKYEDYRPPPITKDGTLTVVLHSWRDFEKEVGKFKEYAYIWRGQRRDMPLVTSYYRDYPEYEGKTDGHLGKFRETVPQADGLEDFFKEIQETSWAVSEKGC